MHPLLATWEASPDIPTFDTSQDTFQFECRLDNSGYEVRLIEPPKPRTSDDFLRIKQRMRCR